MSQLVVHDPKLGSESIYYLKKKLTTVGSERVHDIHVKSEDLGVHFTIAQTEQGFEIHPGSAKLKMNSDRLNRSTRLKSCDRIEWDGKIATFISSDQQIDSGHATVASEGPSLRLLQNLTNSLQNCADFGIAFHQLLGTLIDLSGAEDGLILSDLGESAGWKIVASGNSVDSPAVSSREIFSDTLLNQVLKTREPLYIESIVGNPYADAVSVIQAKIFSVACLPLIVGEKILGVVFLHTHSPGRHIQRSMLVELRVLATQAAMMLISANEISRQRRENSGLNRKLPAEESAFIFQDPSMREMTKTLARLATSNLSVLVLGETGTGKEIAAKEIHRLSSRKAKPFVAINCAAIPVTLLESTLFGYEKGAFTGADRAQTGKFEQADGGTLFLDEIGDLPLELQSKLLRVLQEKAVDPIGGRQSRPIDVRIVAATHQDLDTMISRGKFRQDFYYRLAGAKIKLPALRDRGKDLILLAQEFLERSAPGKSFAQSAVEKLLSHQWPGNVRELEHVIARAAVMTDQEAIEASDIEIEIWTATDERAVFEPISGTLDQAQDFFTRKYVQEALEKNLGNRALTAKQLGISERTLYRIIAHGAHGAQGAQGPQGPQSESATSGS